MATSEENFLGTCAEKPEVNVGWENLSCSTKKGDVRCGEYRII